MPHYFTEITTGEEVNPANLNSRLTELDDQVFALADGTGYEDQVANRVFAGPTSGGDAAPAFRALVADDLTGALDSPPAIGGGTPAAGDFTALTATGLTIATTAPAITIDGTGGAVLNLDGGAGQVDRIALMDDGDDVWRVNKDASDDLVFARYVSDVLQDEALKIINSSGQVVVANELRVVGDLNLDGTNLGFYGTSPIAKPTVTGSKASNAALTSLMTALANLGLVTNSTS